MAFQKKILIFDNKEDRREKLESFLSQKSFKVKETSSLAEVGNHLLNSNDFSLALITLSPHNSYEHSLLRSIKNFNPGLSIILLFNPPTPELTLSLLDQETVDYVVNPDSMTEIYSAVKNGISKKELIYKNNSFKKQLNKIKSEQQKNIRKTMDLEEIYETTLENLITALDLRDVETFGHSRTVAKYSQVLAKILGIKDKQTLSNIRKGALLHDVGKIAIPDAILKKPASLSFEEWDKIKLHPTLGFGLIKEIKLVKEVGNIILYHHERYDGQGYPKKLKNENIPLEARIFSLADALDAITSHRPYRKERDFPTAKKEIQKNSSTQFDPQIVSAFCSLSLKEWEKIRHQSTKFLPFLEEAYII